MASSTRARKRINEYFSSDDQEQNQNNDDVLENDDNEEPAAKRIKMKIPRILDGKYFSIVSNINGNITARCTVCNEEKKGSLTSTGNFKSHFRIKHMAILAKVETYLKANGGETSASMAQPQLHRFVSKPEKVNERMLCNLFS